MAALPFIAAAVSAVGAIRQGNMAASAANYNADSLTRQAGIVNQQTTAKQELMAQRSRAVIGSQLASTAQSGSGLSGSNLDLLGQSLGAADQDSLNIRYQGDLESSGLLANAGVARSQAHNARVGGFLSAAGSLVGGANAYIQQGGRLPGFPAFDVGFARGDGQGMYETGPMGQDWQRRLEKRGY